MREVFALYLHFTHKISVFGRPGMQSFSESIFLLFSHFSCNFSTQKAAKMDGWDRVFKISSWGHICDPQFMWYFSVEYNRKDKIRNKFELLSTVTCRNFSMRLRMFTLIVLRKVIGFGLCSWKCFEFHFASVTEPLKWYTDWKMRKRTRETSNTIAKYVREGWFFFFF